jgi:proteasome lid subunit RPN8/RPN11
MPFRLLLARKFHDEMVAQALAEMPNECCGLLAGVIEAGVGRVIERYPLANIAETPAVEYWSDPRSMFAADKDMRKRGLNVLAVYHSHPTSEAVPSRKDRERNYSVNVVNFILSLLTNPPMVRGWWLTETDHREASWEITTEAQ